MDVKKLKDINDYFIVRHLESNLTYAKGSVQLYKSYQGNHTKSIEY